jgi:hypothetical protein
MASRETTPRLTPDQLADINRKFRQHFLDEWHSILKGKKRLTPRQLRAICESLVDNPLLIENGDYAPYIYLILQRWLAKTKPPSRPYSAKEIATIVDMLINRKVPKTKARQVLADALGMTIGAVKQDHLRHGSIRRDKSR